MKLLQQAGLSTAIAISIAVSAAAGLAHAQQKNFPTKPVIPFTP